MKRKIVWPYVWLLIVLFVLGACGRESGASPDDVVRQAFTAFQEGDSEAINSLMSEQGQSNAALFCAGAVMNCLEINYPKAGGQLTAYLTETLEEGEQTARIRLRTVWAEWGARCQTYELDLTEEGWRITFFSETGTC